MTRQGVLMTLLAAGGFSVNALAAELSFKDWQFAAPSALSWTGCYAGVQGGGALEDDSYAGSYNGANGLGALAGGQAGCNYQTGSFVFGIEGGASWSSIGNKLLFDLPEDYQKAIVKNDWSADISGRLGVSVDRLLIYGKAGLAWGHFTFSDVYQTTGPLYTYNGSGVLLGVLGGVGVEYAFSPKWSAKAEYNYTGYAQKSLNFASTVGGTPFAAQTSEGASEQLIKLGLNFKLN
jgi:outer membrane immunogenic protein